LRLSELRFAVMPWGAIKDADPESTDLVRVDAADGQPYNRASFLEYYGAEDGARRWTAAGGSARTEGLGVATQFTATEDLEKSMSSRLDIFNAFVEEKSKLKKLPARDVLGEAERLEVKDKGIMVLVSILWNTDDVPAAMKKYQGLFQRFMVENDKAQMYALHAMEKLIELDATRLAKTPRYLKTMYDLDLIDEEVFVAWETKFAKQVSKDLSGKIRTAGAAFLSWIKEAEEEESSEDENVAFESAPMANPAKAKAAAKEPEPEEDEDDDLDIDDM